MAMDVRITLRTSLNRAKVRVRQDSVRVLDENSRARSKVSAPALWQIERAAR